MRSHKSVDQNFWQNSNFRVLLPCNLACVKGPGYGRVKVKAGRAVWQNRAKILNSFVRPHCFPFDVTLNCRSF